MSSEREILTKLNLKSRDFNDLPLSRLRDILTELYTQEISLLCGTNKRINTICEDESFWKNVVFQQYGLDKKYGETWRKTAMNMDKANMINLGKKWYDGRTYREIMDEQYKKKHIDVNEFYSLRVRFLRPIVDWNEDVVETIATLDLGEYDLQDLAEEELDRQFTDEVIDEILHIMDREIDVIEAAVSSQRFIGNNDHLPGYEIPKDAIKMDKNGRRADYYIRELIDPVLYLMQYSLFESDILRGVRD
uniref:F-box family protein n=1 Tax=Pithovirus LCPAC404 TaxID=2506597 RepID=A0A481ZE31_9VIRU|nr:MAG: F-box family protein [Pithovirus LCPAC404]